MTDGSGEANEDVDLETQQGPVADDSDETTDATTGKRARRSRLFPSMSFREALVLADAIQTHAAGLKVRRMTLFDAMKRSPTSGPTRTLITASAQYGITTGSYNAEWLELTEKGRIASDQSAPARSRLAAQIDLAINGIQPFHDVYEKLADNKLPSTDILNDEFVEVGVPKASASEATDTFIANARELGLIRTIAGAEYLVKADAVLDDLQADPNGAEDKIGEEVAVSLSAAVANEDGEARVVTPPRSRRRRKATENQLDDVCFIVSPIGEAGSEFRKHADLVLNSLIEPALNDLGLRTIRADRISKPGLITGQVIEHIAQAALVIADLSYTNPNVYYELALRHAVRKPVVQLIRSADLPMPFDVGQYRTVSIDLTDIYTFVPQLDLHRQEIRRQCRLALDEGSPSQTQLSLFYPGFWDQIAQEE